MEKYREKQGELHAAFLDMEKAFDKVLHDVVVGGAIAHGSKGIHPVDKNDLSRSHEPSANRGSTVKTIPHKDRRASEIGALSSTLHHSNGCSDEVLNRQPPWAFLYADL
ncbi:unnamed protein product [Strongylus vulgaris]|uniref:Reverse transcriptase domain-containing protein n=1 Tax=Strongylus vulgaris TaxID=40348 RepID=A0A3P7LAL5_STRVU|nr:unnamed protein product [Strongylus vulgaris]